MIKNLNSLVKENDDSHYYYEESNNFLLLFLSIFMYTYSQGEYYNELYQTDAKEVMH